MDVRMPDGTVIKNVPEGTTKSDLQSRLAKMNGASASNAMPSPPIYVDDGMGGEKSIPWQSQNNEFFSENQQRIDDTKAPSNWAVLGESITREVPSNILGFPADMANIVAEAGKAGYQGLTQGWDTPYYSDPPFATDSQWFRDNVFQEVADRDKYTGKQKLLGNVTTLGTEALTGGVGLASKAKNIDEAGNMLQSVLEPYVSRPKAQVATDVAAGAGAGGGLTVAEETDQGPLATLFLTLLGGGGGVGAAKSVEGGARNIASMGKETLPDGSKVRKSTLQDVSGLTDDMVTNKQAAISNIDESIADADALNIERPTTGPASGDVGLSMLEVKQRQKNPQQFMEKDQSVRTDIADKFNEYRNPDADVTAPQKASAGLIDRQLGESQSGVDLLKQQELDVEKSLVDINRQGEDLISDVASKRGEEGRASAKLNEQIGKDGGLGEMTTMRKEAIDAVDPDGTKTVDAKDFVKRVSQINKNIDEISVSGETGLPGEFVAQLKKVTKTQDGELSLKQLQNMRKPLPDAISRAKKSGNFTLADNLKDLGASIDDVLKAQDDDLVKSALDANEKYMVFFGKDRPYAREYRDTVQRKSATGKADSENIAQFFLNSTSSAADDLYNLKQIAPDAKAFDDAVETYFDAKLANKSSLNPKVVRNYIKDNADVMPKSVQNKYQALVKSMVNNTSKKDETFDKLQSLKKDIRKSEADILRQERSLQAGPFGKMSRYDSDKYVNDIMGAKDRNKQLDEVIKEFGNDQEALDGFKEATVRWLQKKVKGTASSDTDIPDTDLSGRPILYTKLTRTLDDNREALSKVFSEEEMGTLNRMHTIMSKQGNLSRRANSGSDTAQKLTQGEQQAMDVIEGVLRVKFGVLKAGGLMATAKKMRRVIFGESGRKVRADDLLTRMAYDPAVAKHVLEVTPKTVDNGKWISDLNALMATSEAIQEEDE